MSEDLLKIKMAFHVRVNGSHRKSRHKQMWELRTVPKRYALGILHMRETLNNRM